MNLTDLSSLSLQTIFDNIARAAGPLTGVFALLVITMFANVVTGIYAALRTPGAFNLAYLDAFLTDHVLNKWAPIIGTLLGGIMVGGADNILGSGLILAGTGQVIAYEASVFGSAIPNNLRAAATKTKTAPGFVLLSPGVTEVNGPVVVAPTGD